MASDITAGTFRDKNTQEHVSLIDDIDAYEDTTPNKVITKKDLWMCAIRGLFMEGNFNFERMQAGGFAYSIVPALKKIHGDNKADLAKALKNHLQFFNASPKLFTFLLGTAIAMEENKEKPSTVNVMKVAGMGPTGGIGDAIDHMTLMPLTLALGASIAMDGSIAGPFVFFFLYQIVHFAVYFGLMFMGYKAGTAAMVNMSDSTEKLAKAANIMGIFVIGALSATFIKVQTTLNLELGGKVVDLQTALFDKVMPNILPLMLVFFMLKMVKGTGFWAKPPVLIFSTLAAGVVGHMMGIL
ncbi:PTS system mannose/fructose/sorbose family transporter subunit IID [Photobacterium carnosum]|uniref:PTS system mannose/fructose/sorbose family transporter subunit IID n=1 Tax=Photobacterium carnosum TaxID=2023717 RepID=UPI001E542888|nr:PTS system mannose/fructose/sorbose family transporter subunit IID [Photobacterium carnosum]MCD9531270.1 PTS N-acetylgalactosamine transporter subunit IID [Photobacterium carnosum]MCD9539669.1 PTS N-acetylgalactosamine transporter subunit IID [Photobacterium carnosum]MCD9555046.1 PTS mannose/fructose/sorbose transporter family subunit IID [Photobacterium carnosum]MCF2155023.1 PTS N-acetylgalactosamine transporter subunit IID [Photobacterium carnosum]MCF2216960.1 PTS N-acetylgalactosamine tr